MSIQKALKEAGYRTALFGKFLNTWPLRRDPSYLDQWAVIPHISPDGYYGGKWNVNGKIKKIKEYSTTFLRELAIDFIQQRERNDGKPWFLYIAPAAPHFPYDTEPRYTGKPVTVWNGNPSVQEQDRTDKPLWVQAHDAPLRKGQTIRRRQLRTLMSVDDMVAKLFRQLAKLGETNTLALFTSDNGYMWSEHGVTQKRYPYLPSVHVPYMARWPGFLPTGVTANRIVANIDIAPTIAHATGTPFSGFDGKSWFTGAPRDRLLLEFWKRTTGSGQLQNWAATLTPDYHYIEYYDQLGVLIEQEYYDLIDDPWELENLLGDTSFTNDPSLLEQQELTTQLNEDRSCEGTEECP
jgi:arylsulfatase A-like enzyme